MMHYNGRWRGRHRSKDCEKLLHSSAMFSEKARTPVSTSSLRGNPRTDDWISNQESVEDRAGPAPSPDNAERSFAKRRPPGKSPSGPLVVVGFWMAPWTKRPRVCDRTRWLRGPNIHHSASLDR